MNTQQQFRQLPSVDALLSSMPEELAHWEHEQLTQSLRQHLAQLRAEIAAGSAPDISPDDIRRSAVAALASRTAPTLLPVFTLTGTVLDTNLGRAMMPAESMPMKAYTTGLNYSVNMPP